MNDLQHIPLAKYGPVLVTLNTPFPPTPSLVLAKFSYDHPVLDATAVRAQRSMPSIQGKRGISFAGAWMNFGFHEDGWTAGLLAATRYAPVLPEGSVRCPYEVQFVQGSWWGECVASSSKHSGGSVSSMTRDQCRKQSEGILVWALALLFDLFEWTSLRALLGLVLGSMLGRVVRMLRYAGYDV